MTAVNSLIVNEVLRVHGPDAKRLGLDRLDEDALILEFARWAEGLAQEVAGLREGRPAVRDGTRGARIGDVLHLRPGSTDVLHGGSG